MEQKIKWILFDLSGVIVKFILENPEGYTVGSRYFNVETFADFFTSNDHREYCLGHLSHEQLVSRFIKRKKLDLSVEEFNDIVKNDIKPVVGMPELIDTLSKKYKLGIVTNEGSLHTKYKIEGSGIISCLTKIIASYRIHELKPQFAFYKKTLESIQAKSQECIFIDDTQENVDVANSIGMKGILFTDILQLKKDLNTLQLL